VSDDGVEQFGPAGAPYQLTVDQEVGGSNPPSCTSNFNALSQIVGLLFNAGSGLGSNEGNKRFLRFRHQLAERRRGRACRLSSQPRKDHR
jgi:hypothetical protein